MIELKQLFGAYNVCARFTPGFLKKKPQNYMKKYEEHGEKEAISHIRAKTRDDTKLFWKNIAYGFFRNSILLSLATLSLSCSSEYFFMNISIILITIAMTKICLKIMRNKHLKVIKKEGLPFFLKVYPKILPKTEKSPEQNR